MLQVHKFLMAVRTSGGWRWSLPEHSDPSPDPQAHLDVRCPVYAFARNVMNLYYFMGFCGRFIPSEVTAPVTRCIVNK
jgi:hypothetical protein